MFDKVFTGIKNEEAMWKRLTGLKSSIEEQKADRPISEGWCYLPPLPFEYKELEPHINEEIMQTHHSFVSIAESISIFCSERPVSNHGLIIGEMTLNEQESSII